MKPRFLVPKYPYRKLSGTIFHGKQETCLINNKPGGVVSKTSNVCREGNADGAGALVLTCPPKGKLWAPRPRH